MNSGEQFVGLDTTIEVISQISKEQANIENKYINLLNQVKSLQSIAEGGYGDLFELEKNMQMLSEKLENIINEFK